MVLHEERRDVSTEASVRCKVLMRAQPEGRWRERRDKVLRRSTVRRHVRSWLVQQSSTGHINRFTRDVVVATE